jgi:hypothetical protein
MTTVMHSKYISKLTLNQFHNLTTICCKISNRHNIVQFGQKKPEKARKSQKKPEKPEKARKFCRKVGKNLQELVEK